MTTYGIQCSFLSGIIDIGRINKAQNMFLDKEDHTDKAIYSVAQHALYMHDGNLQRVIGDMRVTVVAERVEKE